jgi:hypothetical protein
VQIRRRWGYVTVALSVLVVARLALQALFVPAYEGPDEPGHLARAVAFADRPFRNAFIGEPVDSSIIAGIAARPCGPALRQFHQCPPFGTEPAAFNLLHPLPKLSGTRSDPNPENNQPPLSYFVMGLILRVARRLSGLFTAPEPRLLFGRLTGVTLVACALFLPLRRIAARRSPSFAITGLLLMLLPGAAESLARCANDGPVFLWSAVLVEGLISGLSAPLVCGVLAAGPLIKQTALPVVAVAVVWLWCGGRKRTAIGGLAAAAVVFPVQLLRGWRWGGNYELNRTLPGIAEPPARIALGFLRSVYTFIKTTFWLGEWTFFRAPLWLVIVYFLLIAVLLGVARIRSAPRSPSAHAAGCVIAVMGIVTFIIVNRRFFGGWGGVGGWYVWSWIPWLAVAWNDCLEVRNRALPALIVATASFVVIANWIYFFRALQIYR